MTSPILVTGGTGTLGRHVVRLLLEAGRDVRVLSRHPHATSAGGATYVTGDVAAGDGVDAAVDGVETIVHCAGTAKGDDVKARNVVNAAARAGSPRIVFISVVGADRVPVVSGIDRALFGYFAAKLAAEKVVEDSGLPFSTLRATQFFDAILLTARALAKSPVMPAVGGFQFQPVDAAEVAARLVGMAAGQPQGLVADFAGPAAYTMETLLRGYLRASNKRRLILPISLPGQAARAVRGGATLSPAHAVGRRTWEEFLAETVTAPGQAQPL